MQVCKMLHINIILTASKQAFMKRFALYYCLIAITFALSPCRAIGKETITNPSDNANKQQQKPASFIENKGQIIDQYGLPRRDIQFTLRTKGVSMFIGNGQLHYQWSKAVNHSIIEAGHSNFETYRLDVELVSANKHAEIITEEKIDYVENYYLPQCPDGATAHSYKKITYKNVYPNIDWVIYSSPSADSKEPAKIKYDFIIREGGDYRNIQVQYNGATTLQLKDGALTATTPFGSITENAPYTYNASTGKEISSNFILTGNTLSYNIGTANEKTTEKGSVVIDPYLYFQEYASYYGGDNVEAGNALCNDKNQQIYLAGETKSPNDIATSGAYQNAINGTFYSDGFLVKFSSVGVRLWATYYGGTNTDMFKGIACDSADNIYAAGNTYSTSSIATIGSHQPAYGGNTGTAHYGDGMLIKFNSANGQRIWGTYYGGYGNELLNGITLLKNDIYITGSTQSPNNISTPGTFKAIMDTGSFQGFVVKFNLAGNRQWGTYYGDSGVSTIPYGVDIYDTNSVYIAGTMDTVTSVPNTPSVHYAFATKFSKTGALLWERFTTSETHCYAISVDRFGNIYTGGKTEAAIGISTGGSFKSTKSLGADGYLMSYTSNGAKRWGTYYGGDNEDAIQAIDVSDKINTSTFEGGIYVTGKTSSTNGIATAGSIQDSLFGSSFSSWPDVFVANFIYTGTTRPYATYYGGPAFEEGNAILCPTNSASVWVAGTTHSDSNIAKPGANHQSYYGSAGQSSLQRGDAFLAEYAQHYDPPAQPFLGVVIKQPFIDTVFCQGDSFNLAYSIFTTYKPGNTFEVWISGVAPAPFTPTPLYTKIGSIKATQAGSIPCKIPESLKGDTSYTICIKCDSPVNALAWLYSQSVSPLRVKKLPAYPIASNNSPICEGDTLKLFATDTSLVGYDWKGPNNYSTSAQNPFMYNAMPTASGDYIVRASYNGCGRYDTTTVIVHPDPHLQDATSNSPICVGDTLHLRAIDSVTGTTYSWTGPAFTSTAQNPNINNAGKTNEGLYKVVATLGTCTAEDTTRVKIGTRPAIDVTGNGPLCAGDTLELHVQDTVTGNTYSWSGPDNFGGNQKDIQLPLASTKLSGLFSVKAGKENCYTTDTVTVIINPIPDIEAGNNGPIWTGQQLQLYATSILGGVNYTWTGPNGFTSGNQTPFINGVKANAAGTYTVIAEANGCSASAATIVTIRKPLSDSMMVLFPNPSQGKLTLIGTTIIDQTIPIDFLTADGKLVYSTEAKATGNIVYTEITLPGSLANAVYMMRLRVDGKTRTLRFVLRK